jgi:TolB-like protein/peroxiredoxin
MVTTNVTLKHELDSFMSTFMHSGPPQIVDAIVEHIDDMVADGIAENALKAGTAPNFKLPNPFGELVELSTLLQQGPVVVAFYRGEWCPFGNMQLHAYQKILPEIKQLGAALVAISPQDADHSLSMAEWQGLEFHVLTDSGNAVARQYGLVFSVEQPVREVYMQLGFSLPTYNGDNSWELPVPGVFIVNRSGVISLAHADADFTHRMEPAAILEGLGALKNQTSQSTVRALQVPVPAPAPEEICAQVERMLASRLFTRSKRMCRFLRFSVEQSLAGKSAELKEQIIGVWVFDRKPDYDPRIDPIVRVEARRLRAKLRAYYNSPGRGDHIMIGLPKGAYMPFFRTRAAAPQDSTELAPVANGSGKKSIVVLPFTNLLAGTDDDYFSDGLTEELIHLLTRVPNLRVVAWATASQLRGRERDLAGIRQQLHVGTILRGSVRRTEGRVRVTARLIDSESGDYLWSETYDRRLENVIAIQEEMARAIVQGLRFKLTVQSAPMVSQRFSPLN